MNSDMSDDNLQALLVEVTAVANQAQRLRDYIVATDIAVPSVIDDQLTGLCVTTAHLRDAIHDAGLDPADDTVRPRLSRV